MEEGYPVLWRILGAVPPVPTSGVRAITHDLPLDAKRSTHSITTNENIDFRALIHLNIHQSIRRRLTHSFTDYSKATETPTRSPYADSTEFGGYCSELFVLAVLIWIGGEKERVDPSSIRTKSADSRVYSCHRKELFAFRSLIVFPTDPPKDRAANQPTPGADK